MPLSMLNAFSTCWYFWLPMGFSGYSSTVSHRASVSMQHEGAADCGHQEGRSILPLLGEAGLSSGKASLGREKTEKGGEEPGRV